MPDELQTRTDAIIHARVNEKIPATKIAARLKMDVSKVYSILRRAGLGANVGNRVRDAHIESLLKEGGVCEKFIAKKYELTISGALAAIRRAKNRALYNDNINRRQEYTDERIRHLYESEKWPIDAIASAAGLGPQAIRLRLNKLGVRIYTSQQRLQFRYMHMTEEDRRCVADAAHAALRGKKKSKEVLVNMAKAREGKSRSHYESALCDALRKEGMKFEIEHCVDVINIDIAFPEFRLAVEVDGGGWHAEKSKAISDTRKSNFLAMLGWRTFRVLIPSAKVKDRLIADAVRDIKTCINTPSLTPV